MRFTKLQTIGIWLAAIVASLVLASCKDDSTPQVQPNPEPPTEPEQPLGTAVLVYMVADNSLGTGRYDVADLDEMQQAVDAGVLKDGDRLLVYRNRRGTDAGKPPVLIEMKQGAAPDTLVKYADDPSIYSTDPERMQEVLNTFVNEIPAQYRGLVFWSHATGWISDKGARAPQKSWGSDRGVKMSMPSLAKGLEGKQFDFIYFDCCHMMTVEGLYEIRANADLFAGSVTEIPAAGMPYDLTLPHFFSPDGPDVLGAAKETFNHYDAMSGADRTCTISVVKASTLDNLAACTMMLLSTGAVEGLSTTQYQQYSRSFSYRLYDFGQWACSLTPTDDAMLQQWEDALSQAIIFAAATPTVFEQLALNHYSGLACGIPKDFDEAEQQGFTALKWWTDVAQYNKRLNPGAE